MEQWVFELLTIVALIMGGAAIALAILGIILSWLMYRSSSELQNKSQNALDQMKATLVEVSGQTNRHLEKTIGYLTRHEPDEAASAELEARQQEQFEVLKKESSAEIRSQIEKLGLDADRLDVVMRKVNEVVEQNVQVVSDIGAKGSIRGQFMWVYDRAKMLDSKRGISDISEISDAIYMTKSAFILGVLAKIGIDVSSKLSVELGEVEKYIEGTAIVDNRVKRAEYIFKAKQVLQEISGAMARASVVLWHASK